MIKHLKKHKIPIAVATSSHHKAFLLKTSNNRDLFDLFDGHITCGDDPAIQHGKPAPDLFLNAAKKLGHDLKDTSDCLVFEDAPSGVMAAYNVNVILFFYLYLLYVGQDALRVDSRHKFGVGRDVEK